MLQRAGLPWQPGKRLHVAEYLDADDLSAEFLHRCVARALCTELELTQVSCTANHVRQPAIPCQSCTPYLDAMRHTAR